MRKVITLFLLVFALALGATAQVVPAIPDDPTAPAILVQSGAVAEVAPSALVETMDGAVSVSDEAISQATILQEGEPAEASIYIGVMLLAIIGLLLTGLRRLNFTAKRQARTLLFQPPQTT